jgi:predicted pyridoxine 5'-phosphate oxidase superfamily flavin-nucleotide-binding protein
METPFHPGEIEIQRRAGTLADARVVGRTIRPSLPAGASRFLARQRFAVAASLDREGRVRASLLSGAPGFISVVDDEMLRLAGGPLDGDPLRDDLQARPELGLLVLDPRTRQRMRFNGRGLLRPEGLFLLLEQAYGNCPKYIQRRAPRPDAAEERPGPAKVSDALDPGQMERIRRSDTLFIASFHPQGGADASHRGGFRGFVRVAGPRRLAFDDFPGNGMFNTLGNLVANPSCGLLFVDFEDGDLLQVAGRARVGEDFSVELDVGQVRDTPRGCALRWSLVDDSPADPGVSHAPPGGIPSEDKPVRTRGRSDE